MPRSAPDRRSSSFAFNGQKVKLTYSTGPDHGIWQVAWMAQPILDEDTGSPGDRCYNTPRTLRRDEDLHRREPASTPSADQLGR